MNASRCPIATAEAALLLLTRGRADMARRVLEGLPGAIRAALKEERADSYAAGHGDALRQTRRARPERPEAPAGGTPRPAFRRQASELLAAAEALGVHRAPSCSACGRRTCSGSSRGRRRCHRRRWRSCGRRWRRRSTSRSERPGLEYAYCMPIWHLMSKLVRKMVRITEPQAAYLDAEAERLGISETEVLRRLIDEARGAKLGTAAGRRPPRGGARKSTRA